jgi:4-amino-4-deoxy-L-arabinose transferase-like glycosyltransferase
MSKTLARPDYRAPLSPSDMLRLIRILLALALGLRLIYAAAIELVPDEAYYWLWSRHLALGYFDHPPMIAYLIRAGTWLLGDNPIGVRAVMAVMSVGTILIIMTIARRILPNERATVWVSLMWIASPLLLGLGILATPDTPVVFFSTAALAFVALIAKRDDQEGAPQASPGLWLLFGLFSGLAMVSKYTGVLLPAAVALAMLTSAKGRGHYRRPWIYLSGMLALVVFSPVILWNKRHQWASFLFQIKHGTMIGGTHPADTTAHALSRFFIDIGTYLGGQLLVWTPILFFLVVVVLYHYWRHYRTLGQTDRLLLWTGTVPLVFFLVTVIPSHHTELNWPAFAYVPCSLLIGRWLSQGNSPERFGWVRGGVQVSAGFVIAMLVIFAPPMTARIVRLPFHVPHLVRDTIGWPQFARWMSDQAMQAGGALIVTNRHQDAGEAAFYIQGQPEVWSEGIGSRPNAFAYFDDPPPFSKIPVVFWVGGHHELFAKKYGYKEVAQSTYRAFAGRNPDPRVESGYVLVHDSTR